MQFISLVPADKPRKHVMVGIGAGDGTVEVPCVLSLFSAAPLLYAAGISITLCIEAGNCHVDDMRNGIVTTFLESDCDELVFIDEDVGFQAVDLARLILHDRDVVGGVYPKKEDEANFPVYTDPGIELWSDEDGLVEVQGLPTGFLKIKRHVLEKLAEKAVCFVGSDDREYHVIFERIVADGRRWSGDYAFCRKWLKMGGKLYTDPSFVLSHTGKKVWVGDLGSFWKRKHGVEAGDRENKLETALEDIRRGKIHNDTFELLAKGWGNEPWAASPEFLRAVHDNACGYVVECGSGASTLLLAAMGCEVTTLEHEEEHAARVLWNLRKYGLEDRVNLICKPLKYGWYDFAGATCDTLVIDGPPRELADRTESTRRIKANVVIWDDFEATKQIKVLENA